VGGEAHRLNIGAERIQLVQQTFRLAPRLGSSFKDLS
jgi:hypothetical protein